ncbi:hypothetical protein IB227_12275 [Stenotrophomonas sp. STM01]|uniref:hypothetical protein n=1 Tax=unclassified Stenotrophomonas TaxID=196198 RepID=UPI001404E7E6|nr:MULTISPECIES: hypothetical protein [unclassified Stenotrophomonas]MBD9536627.1 hypothetical protein [Stenotrophomonas sp. STM01]
MSMPPQGSNPNARTESQKESSPPSPVDKDGKKVDPLELVPQAEPVEEGQQDRKAANDS